MPKGRQQPLGPLDGRVVVVAGAGGGGIGTRTCARALEAGADVVAIDRSEQALEELLGDLDAPAGRLQTVLADLCTAEGVDAAVEAAVAWDEQIHGLVNVAGGTGAADFGPLLELDRQGWDSVVDRNLRYVVFLNQAVARIMVAAGGGAIVNISSVSGLASQPYLAAYGAAKAGLNSLTRTMAVEWGGHGIRVNAIAPGSITTPRAGSGEPPGASRRAVPLGRRGSPDEIATVAVFLLSPAASYVTGQVLAVDGGMSVKLAMLDEQNMPVFVADPASRANMTSRVESSQESGAQ